MESSEYGLSYQRFVRAVKAMGGDDDAGVGGGERRGGARRRGPTSATASGGGVMGTAPTRVPWASWGAVPTTTTKTSPTRAAGRL